MNTSLTLDERSGWHEFASLEIMRKVVSLFSLVIIGLLSACAADPAQTETTQAQPSQQPAEAAPEAEDTAAPSEAPSQPGWVVSDFSAVAPEGVSAHLARTDFGYRLAYGSYGAGGWVVSECSFDWECSVSGTIDRVADLTVVTLASGELRAYFVEINPDTKQKEIFTAKISEDWLTLTDRKSIGFNDGGSLAWGVPDAVVTPEGLVRVYWVIPGEGMANERVISATSVDSSGIEFVLDEGDRLTGGYVDFEVVTANEDGWLAIASSSPEGLPRNPQGLFIATSADGLVWEIAPESISPSDMSYLDPTAVLNDSGDMELVISRATNDLGQRDYELVRSVISQTD